MIKAKNKQIYKQTNKQINILLYPKYLSQIKSDHHEIFRETVDGVEEYLTDNKLKLKKTNPN